MANEHQHAAQVTHDEDSALAPQPDHENSVIRDAEYTYVATLMLSALFVGAVFIFIL